MYVHQVYACSGWPEEGVGSPGTGVTVENRTWVSCLEQPVLLATQPSL